MKRVTFIIGNGFDCKYKLKTTYKNFLDVYSERPSATPVIAAFKERIRAEKDERGYGNWSDLERQMGKYEPNTLPEFLECYDDVVKELSSYLRLVSDENIGLDREDIRNIPYFREGFFCFLVRFLRGEASDTEEIARLRARVGASPNRFDFILLNYTSTLSDCIKHATEPSDDHVDIKGKEKVVLGQVLQAHGDLDRIVFGVSDESQAVPRFLTSEEYRRRMIKSERIKDLGEHWLEEGEEMIRESGLIAIFGSSLGETDHHWWRAIAHRLAEEEECHLIVYFHLSDDPRLTPEEKANEAQGKAQEISQVFLSFVPDHPEILERIHVIFEEQRFLETFIFLEAHLNVGELNIAANANVVPSPRAEIGTDPSTAPSEDTQNSRP